MKARDIINNQMFLAALDALSNAPKLLAWTVAGSFISASVSLIRKSAGMFAMAIASFMVLCILHGMFAKELYSTSSFQPNAQSSQKLQDLIATLKKGDSYDRHRAIIALGASGDKGAVDPLIKALGDNDYFVRGFAARALGNINDPDAVLPLIKALDDEYPLVQQSAAQALGSLKDSKAVDPLIKALDSNNYLVQRSAAMALGELGDAKAVDPLIKLLGSNDTFIQSGAATALFNIGEPALPKLVAGLCDWTIGPKAVEILKDLKWQPSSDQEKVWFDAARRNKQSLAANWEVVKKVLLNDANSENINKVQNAVFALISIGRDEAIDALVEILGKKGNVEIANAFADCGNAALSESGRKWLRDNKAESKSRSKTPIVQWGEMK
jgi:HEAT repeat protein